ncbi:hypothetical protein PtrEW7m1_010151 [Pyrenophora tritici-repentis]|nr:hypothetical protein PtrEW7m1_010151 [Pyrenophora tritici-repentis]
MPFTYGDGQETARRRLQAGIEASGSAPSVIPFSQNESFVVCESQLAELEAKLFSDDQTTTTLSIVVQAAACMNASSMTLQQHQAQLPEHKKAALEYSDDSSEGKLRGSGLEITVTATLFLSISQVRHVNAIAADYFLLAACVDLNDIPLDLLKAASPRASEDAIKVLDRYVFATGRPAESALNVHRLVHHALRKRLQVQGRL